MKITERQRQWTLKPQTQLYLEPESNSNYETNLGWAGWCDSSTNQCIRLGDWGRKPTSHFQTKQVPSRASAPTLRKDFELVSPFFSWKLPKPKWVSQLWHLRAGARSFFMVGVVLALQDPGQSPWSWLLSVTWDNQKCLQTLLNTPLPWLKSTI